MNRDGYPTLSPRELECLRLVGQGLQSKEIAARLEGISPGTVDGYIKSAIGKLGVANRRDAARIVLEVEQLSPQWLGDHPPGVDPPAAEPPEPASSTSGRRLRLPFRRPGELDNDLSVGERLLWIVVLAIAVAIAFGMLSTGLMVIVRLLGSIRLLNDH